MPSWNFKYVTGLSTYTCTRTVNDGSVPVKPLIQNVVLLFDGIRCSFFCHTICHISLDDVTLVPLIRGGAALSYSFLAQIVVYPFFWIFTKKVWLSTYLWIMSKQPIQHPFQDSKRYANLCPLSNFRTIDTRAVLLKSTAGRQFMEIKFINSWKKPFYFHCSIFKLTFLLQYDS